MADISAMTVAIVIDDKDGSRKKILQSVLAVSTSLGVNSNHVTLQKLTTEAGQVMVQTADVTVIDLSDHSQWCNLFYHVGARESLGRRKNLFLVNKEQLPLLKQVLERPKVPRPTYDLMAYSVYEDGTIRCGTSSVPDGESKQGEEHEGKAFDLSVELQEKLQNALAGSKQGHPPGHRRASLYSAKTEETTIEDATTMAFYRLFIALRKVQDYNGIISAAERLKTLPGHEDLTKVPKIGYPYAFALNWRNEKGDRERALAELSTLLDNTDDEAEMANIMCLCGRIFKDIYIDSAYTDRHSLRISISWYRRAFETDPNPFSGINLATLLKASAGLEDTNDSLCVGALVSYWLGRVGSFSSSDVYWDLATALELGVAFQNFPMAVSAAEKIFDVKPSPWCLQSTLKNIEILLHLTPLRKTAEQIILDSWISLFRKSLI